MIISIDTPPSPERFNPGKKIGVVFGFTPNEVFDVQEGQSDGSIINRTFQVKYFATLTSLGPAPLSSPSSGTGLNTQLSQQTLSANTLAVSNQNFQTLTLYNQPSSSIHLNPNTSNLINLVRSTGTNSIGQYEYYIQRSFLLNYRNLEDTTRYKFTVKAELWGIKPGTTNVWEKAKSNSVNFITETRTAIFSSGILQPITIQPALINNYQNRLRNNSTNNQPTNTRGR